MKRSLKLFAKLQAINQAIQETEADNDKSGKISLAQLRASLVWSQNQLARVMNASDRAIVNARLNFCHGQCDDARSVEAQ